MNHIKWNGTSSFPHIATSMFPSINARMFSGSSSGKATDKLISQKPTGTG